MCTCNVSSQDKQSMVQWIKSKCSHCAAQYPAQVLEFAAVIDAHLDGTRRLSVRQWVHAQAVLLSLGLRVP